ncbi:MAG: FAD-dependent oxidoreductase [Desulfotignum sp.]|nr:FAD-dependent oxidoreductase [Desulfotignum sp.]MCF8138727.1 FAD-dependent oxidoreductase [Desulfotignum sp.]
MKKHLVLVGGGHAHMVTLANIRRFVEKKYRVTVIGPSEFHYYSGMGPGMLGGTYSPDQIRFATRKMVENQGGEFVTDRVIDIAPRDRQVMTRSGARIDYDVVSFNAGSHIPLPGTSTPEQDRPANLYPVKPIEQLMNASTVLKTLFAQKKVIVNVVGGGPSSAEVAGNVWQLARNRGGHMPEIRILCGSRFMGRFGEKIRSRVKQILEKRKIVIQENARVKTVTSSEITLESGQGFATDFTFMASGVIPTPMFAESGLAMGPDKGLLVNQYLQCVTDPQIFGGGDCIHFQPQPLDKVGVYAVRQNPVLLHNLMAALDGGALKPFDPGPDYLLVFNLGGGQGVLKKKNIVFSGRLAFTIKDYIDTKFMKRFQAAETGQ